jgi:hypothetical protein
MVSDKALWRHPISSCLHSSHYANNATVITHLQGHLKEHPNRLPNSPIPQLETTNEQDDDGGGDNTEQEEEAAPVAKEKERKMIETPEKDETQEKAERRQLRSRAPAAAIPQPAKQKATLLHRPKRRKISMNRYDKAGAAPPHRDDPPRGIKAVDDETAREIAELLWSTEGVEAQEEALDGILWLNPWLKANLVRILHNPDSLLLLCYCVIRNNIMWNPQLSKVYFRWIAR